MDAVCPALQSYIRSLSLLFYRSQAYFSACSFAIVQMRLHIPSKKKLKWGNEMHEVSFNKGER